MPPHLFCFADWKAISECVFFMQILKKLAVHTVLYCVHHLCLCQHCLPLLLNPVHKEFWVEGYLCQRIKHLSHKQICQMKQTCQVKKGGDLQAKVCLYNVEK